MESKGLLGSMKRKTSQGVSVFLKQKLAILIARGSPSLGITQPQGTSFKPAGQVTRAQMASFVVRTFSVLNK